MIRSVDNPKTKSPIKWEVIDTSANAIEFHIFTDIHLAVIRNLSKWQRDSQFADKILFRWHWTLRSVFGSSVFVITVIKTDWKSLWTQKRHLVIFTFNQCKMMMTGANLHHVKWIPVVKVMYILKSNFVVSESTAPLFSVQLEPYNIHRNSLGPVLTPPGANCPLNLCSPCGRIAAVWGEAKRIHS